MNLQTLGFALAAGSVAAVNPCGFAMLPAYLALVVFGEEGQQPSRAAALGRALVATSAMAAGFTLVFGVFGLIIAPLAASVQRYLPGITVVVGASLIGLGVWMLTGRELTVLLPKTGRGAPSVRLASMFGYGLAYATASLSCTIGPFLAVTGATFGSGSVLAGIGAYLGYGAGMALVVGVLAGVVAIAGAAAVGAARRVLPYVTRLAGTLLVVVGGYVGYYGIYELRLNFAHAGPRDLVIETAQAVQQTLLAWLDAIGLWPLIAALVALVAVAVTLGKRAKHRRVNTAKGASGGAAGCTGPDRHDDWMQHR